MNVQENRMANQENDFMDNIGWFAAGAVLGMAAAMLLAPKSGKETRRFISEKTQQGRDAVVDTGKDVYEQTRDMVDKGRRLVEDAADLFERGRKLVRG
jgi:gas vesicle protein